MWPTRRRRCWLCCGRRKWGRPSSSLCRRISPTKSARSSARRASLPRRCTATKSQSQRERALDAFRARTVQVLVATDIAARGIDVDTVTHVFNHDLPSLPESYVHRIGRTGRAGRSGFAVTLCDAEQRAWLHDVEREIGLTLTVQADHPCIAKWRGTRPNARLCWAVGRSSSRKCVSARSGPRKRNSPHAWRQRPPETSLDWGCGKRPGRKHLDTEPHVPFARIRSVSHQCLEIVCIGEGRSGMFGEHQPCIVSRTPPQFLSNSRMPNCSSLDASRECGPRQAQIFPRPDEVQSFASMTICFRFRSSIRHHSHKM